MEENIKNMAELLKNGNTMLDIVCPQCNSPLFELKNGDIYCGNCQKKVVVLKDEEELASFNKSSVLTDIDDVLYAKIVNITNLIKNENNLDQQTALIKLLYNYLLTIEKLKTIKKS
ncbi:MAG: hypothetical protein GF329_01195 [Candidatus Lokiarchaeota archaeon]|nr:hypothetical protein [Candidatus Lokiarchaeota archaeon]